MRSCYLYITEEFKEIYGKNYALKVKNTISYLVKNNFVISQNILLEGINGLEQTGMFSHVTKRSKTRFEIEVEEYKQYIAARRIIEKSTQLPINNRKSESLWLAYFIVLSEVIKNADKIELYKRKNLITLKSRTRNRKKVEEEGSYLFENEEDSAEDEDYNELDEEEDEVRISKKKEELIKTVYELDDMEEIIDDDISLDEEYLTEKMVRRLPLKRNIELSKNIKKVEKEIEEEEEDKEDEENDEDFDFESFTPSETLVYKTIFPKSYTEKDRYRKLKKQDILQLLRKEAKLNRVEIHYYNRFRQGFIRMFYPYEESLRIKIYKFNPPRG